MRRRRTRWRSPPPQPPVYGSLGAKSGLLLLLMLPMLGLALGLLGLHAAAARVEEEHPHRLRALQEPPPSSSAASTTLYTADALADEIRGPLPGLSPEAASKAGRFRQFSGYLPISEYK